MCWLFLSRILLVSILFTFVHFQYKYPLLLSLLFTFISLPLFSKICLLHFSLLLTATTTPVYKKLKSDALGANIVQTTCSLSSDTNMVAIPAQKLSKDRMLNGPGIFFCIPLTSSNLVSLTIALESKTWQLISSIKNTTQIFKIQNFVIVSHGCKYSIGATSIGPNITQIFSSLGLPEKRVSSKILLHIGSVTSIVSHMIISRKNVYWPSPSMSGSVQWIWQVSLVTG